MSVVGALMAEPRPACDWLAGNHVTAVTQSCRVQTQRSTLTTATSVWIPELFAEAAV